jgi:putative transposase
VGAHERRYGRRVSRVPRSSLPDGFFHVASRGALGSAIYADDVDRLRFLKLLARCEKRRRWKCHAYCLMTTHYHLVLECRRVDLSRGLHWLNWLHALEFNKRHGRFGHVFAGRFTARSIMSEEYLFEACAYVVLNPVKAGLCTFAEEWPWSCCRFGLESA